MEFQIDNMTCGGCAASVTKAIRSVDPDAKVDVDLATKKVRIGSQHEKAAFAAVLSEVGYPAKPGA